MGTYGFSGSPIFVTVATTGTYNITSYGAQGGSSVNGAGGKGAEEGGTFNLVAGEHLEIIVGGTGKKDTIANGTYKGAAVAYGGGGGGGTFVFANTGPKQRLRADPGSGRRQWCIPYRRRAGHSRKCQQRRRIGRHELFH